MAADDERDCKLPNHAPFYYLFIYGFVELFSIFFLLFAFHQPKLKCFDAFNHNTTLIKSSSTKQISILHFVHYLILDQIEISKNRNLFF